MATRGRREGPSAVVQVVTDKRESGKESRGRSFIISVFFPFTEERRRYLGTGCTIRNELFIKRKTGCLAYESPPH